jgi:hypothetical protein
MPKKTLAQKAREAGLTPETVKRRIKNGWTEKKALSTPFQTNKSHPKKKVMKADPEIKPDPMEKIDAATDGFTLTISIMILGLVVFGLLWLLTK